MCSPLPRPTLFPYTTLFRSKPNGVVRLFHALSPATDPDSAKVLAFSYPQLAEGIYREERASAELTAILPEVPEPKNDSLQLDRKSTRLNSSHTVISYAVFCLNVLATPETYTLSLHDALPI